MTTWLLLATALLWPVLLACAWIVPPLRMTAVRLAPTLALPALVLAFTGDAHLELQAPGLFTSMRLGVDAIGRPFLLLTALLWSVAGFQAATYMRHDARRTGFTGFLLFTGLGNVGVTLAQDALSFYLFFALMSFAAYGLVVHARTREALRAGRIYIIMAVAGEALILAGLFGIMAMAQDAAFTSIPDAYAALTRPGAVAALLLFGFGVKAGLMPLHLWLPLAHPVAPTPASALLSGAMIKAGVLAWLRFLPVGTAAFGTAGAAAMLLGTAATIIAAILGVMQRDVKTVLAYSSVSQMGFLAVGVGAALVVPAAAPLLVLAVAVYAIHHATAKGALFLGVAVVAGTRPRWLLAAAAVPGLVLAGAPLTSGAIAKAALKDALGDVPPPGALPIDVLLSVAAVGTTLLMARYVSLLALEPPGGERSRSVGLVAPWLALVMLSALAAIWLPVWFAPLGELPLATSPAYLAAAFWPLGLGILLALVAYGLARRYPALTVPTVPAGDVVALLERGARRAAVLLAPLARFEPAAVPARAVSWLESGAGRLVDRGSAAWDRAARGPLLGLVFVVVALLLFAAVR